MDLLKKYNDDDKKYYVLEYARLILETDTPAVELSKSLGVTIVSLDKWARERPELGDILLACKTERAHRKVLEADRIASDDTQDIRQFHGNSAKMGDFFEEREFKTAFNRSQWRAQRLDNQAALLAPDYFGDHSKDIKELQKAIAEIAKQLSQE